MDADRYHRQTILPEIGEAGQRRLASASVLVVGLGGLGAPVATYLCGAGVGTVGLCDFDTVSVSNLQRQILYSEADVGKAKVAMAAARLHAINSDVRIAIHADGLTEENAEALVSGYDIVVDCTDGFAVRYLIDDVCHRLGKPWVHGAIGAFSGCVAVMNGSSGRRYTDLYPDRDALCSRGRAAAGVIGPVPGVVGAVQASEAMKLAVGIPSPLDGAIWTINLQTLESQILRL